MSLGQLPTFVDPSLCQNSFDSDVGNPEMGGFKSQSPNEAALHDFFFRQTSTEGSSGTSSGLTSATGMPQQLLRHDSGYTDTPSEPQNPQPTTTPANKTNRASRPLRGHRVPHRLVERRYRDNLNGQIEALMMAIPSMREAQAYSISNTDNPGVLARMPSKTAIITAAVEHINELHAQEAKWSEAETTRQDQVPGLQRLARCDDCSIAQYLQSVNNQGQTMSP